MKDFNLIVSTYRFREEEAQDEILDLLEQFGDPDSECEITDIKGILLARTTIDPTDVVAKLKDLTSSDPWQIRYVLRVLPIQAVVATDLQSIRHASAELASRIKSADKFRVTVEKRHSPITSGEIISSVAEVVQSRVDLENPDWVVLVQVLGAQTGVSVITPRQIFSSTKEKRQ
ncbi:MAG TPA: THUMP domain-containing protein [Nitrososphaera sp.]|jgi:tRNA acetyltransferase TAN1